MVLDAAIEAAKQRQEGDSNRAGREGYRTWLH